MPICQRIVSITACDIGNSNILRYQGNNRLAMGMTGLKTPWGPDDRTHSRPSSIGGYVHFRMHLSERLCLSMINFKSVHITYLRFDNLAVRG